MLGICIWYVMSLASKSVSGEAAVPLCRYAAIGDVLPVCQQPSHPDTTLPLQHAEMASLQCVHFCQTTVALHFTFHAQPKCPRWAKTCRHRLMQMSSLANSPAKNRIGYSTSRVQTSREVAIVWDRCSR
ncbi:hypothetical protein J3E68DRAFT_87302 [Trichoderma sp. SZMC 28012]